MLIKTELLDVSNSIEAVKLDPESDRCLLEQHEEQISSLESEVTEASHNIAPSTE